MRISVTGSGVFSVLLLGEFSTLLVEIFTVLISEVGVTAGRRGFLAGATIGLFTLLTETGLLMGITGWIGTEASKGKSNEDT